MVTIDRQWWEGRWQINLRWKGAVLTGEAREESGCLIYPELIVQERTYNGDGQTWLLENRYSVRTTDYFEGSECPARRIRTLRWLARIGWGELANPNNRRLFE
jgi:hypothetical protein